jgi:L-lactate dehydrogenase (cytochrome)
MQAAQCPAWLSGIRKTGMPRLRLMESYTDNRTALPSNHHIGYLLRTSPDWDYFKSLRDVWDGPLIVRAATPLPVIFDSGIEGGLDVLRALASGADFVMLGRAFHYGLGALGEPGAAHVLDILRQDMISNMGQLGAKTLRDLPKCLRSTH